MASVQRCREEAKTADRSGQASGQRTHTHSEKTNPDQQNRTRRSSFHFTHPINHPPTHPTSQSTR